MFLSVQQYYILNILQKLGCIRKGQLLVLVREKFRRPDLVISTERLETMLWQLRFGMRDLRVEEDMVLWAGVPKDDLNLEAIDIMLELSGGVPLDFKVERNTPFLLSFSLGGKTLRLFSVIVLTETFYPGSLDRRKMERIIWISKDGLLPSGLELPTKQFFAARQADGTHRFYGSTEL